MPKGLEYLKDTDENRKWIAQHQFSQEVARHGIKMKVEDARSAGIHPLAALGAPTHQPSLTPVGSSDYGMSAMGQDVSSAYEATATQPERDGYTERLAKERAELENDLLRARIESIRGRRSKNPPLPGVYDPNLIEGQGNAPGPLREATTYRDLHGHTKYLPSEEYARRASFLDSVTNAVRRVYYGGPRGHLQGYGKPSDLFENFAKQRILKRAVKRMRRKARNRSGY